MMYAKIYIKKSERGHKFMDRYLFGQFVFEMNDELYDNTCVAIAQIAENIVKTPHSNRVTFNYYPQEHHRLQLVACGYLDDDTVHMENIKMHHTSEDVWKLKIVTDIDACDSSYLVTRPDGYGLTAIRLVNEQVLDNIENDRIIEAQVIAFAVNVNIYQDETSYANSVSPSTNGQKIMMKDGIVVAANYLVNNNANLTAEERNNKDHCFDNIVDICGTITTCNKFSLNMFHMDMNNYYMANVMTDFGPLKIFIAQPLFPKGIEGFGVGNVIVGKVMLSGDVCIYDYEKYASQINEQSNKTVE